MIEPAIESIERWEALASCGFPSPALDYAQDSLNLNDYFLNHPSATFAITARGDSMIDYGIYDGDILFVDRAAEARTGTSYSRSSTELHREGNRPHRQGPELHPYNANENYRSSSRRTSNFWIEGVVVSLGRRFHRRPRTAAPFAVLGITVETSLRGGFQPPREARHPAPPPDLSPS